MRKIQLSREEEDLVLSVAKRFLVECPATVHEVLTIAIKRWRELVSDLAAGYTYTVYDYSNDLSQRELISLLLLEAPAKLRQAVRESIESIDAQFKQYTHEEDHGVLQPLRQPEMWWYDRTPTTRAEDDF